MKLLEIKNNLVKLSYGENENPILGKFIVLATSEKSYVAQLVNLKSDNVNNFAIAKLLFTFTPDGIVDNYDGSIPSMASQLSFLDSAELLDLLPVETAVKIGQLAQQNESLSLDISVFEHNFTVFAERETDKTTFISNCIRQLFQMKEKSVIVDLNNNFADYSRIEFAKDFKLPLNSEMIDFIFEYELAEVDPSTKAVIQDVFYAVQQYIKTLDFEFLPIDNFVDVVANQYKETQMPELALLKNKLLKYRDSNIFANTKEEVLAFNQKLEEKNCSIVNLTDVNEALQKEVLVFVHKALESIKKYVYFFCPLTDGNSDKKLLKRFINNNHVFTTIIVSNSYKYVKELKSCAENVVIFAPEDAQHEFAAYNTFLNKLNLGECIVFGKLTQGIPFIVEMSDLDLDLTKDDVLGDKYQFVPVQENVEMMATEDVELSKTLDNTLIPTQLPEVEAVPETSQIDVEDTPVDVSVAEQEVEEIPQEELPEEDVSPVDEEVLSPEGDVLVEYPDVPQDDFEDVSTTPSNIVEPVGNLLGDDLAEGDLEASEFPPQEDDDLGFDDVVDLSGEDSGEELPDLTEDDLDFIEDNSVASQEEVEDVISEPMQGESYVEDPYIEEQTPVVPVYPAQDTPIAEDDFQFSQGDAVTHPRYGRGVIEKIIKYGNKTLCSISFENVGRRLLDPSISEFTKL